MVGRMRDTLSCAIVLKITKQKGTSMAQSSQANSARDRYKNAYLVAGTITFVGGSIKGISIILAGVIAVSSILKSQQLGQDSGQDASFLMYAGLGFALVTGVIGYILGILVCAVGEIHKATLDSAVNTSPFLSDNQKAEAMSLPHTSTVSSQDNTPASQILKWKCVCGHYNSEGVQKCSNCQGEYDKVRVRV
jgi:hypothetical protein